MKTPVLLLMFNRPNTTKLVFEKIKQYQPEHLYVAADGPRIYIKEETELCNRTKKIIENIDWPCKIHTLYRKQNLGCKNAVSSAIDWFFHNVDQGIILEDDCLPDLSFFDYCSELLHKYKNDSRVMHIGGNNFQNGIIRGEGDYYFSKYPHIWGWATWKRAWKKYDVKVSHWPTIKNNNSIQRYFSSQTEKLYWNLIFNMVYKNRIDTWDYQWLLSIWSCDGLSITPNKNLVSNIGFGKNSTHTNIKNSSANIPSQKIINPLKHPKNNKIDKDADDYTSRKLFKINPIHTFLKFIYDSYKFHP